MPFNSKTIPQALIDALKGNNCALFVGAGLSVGAGLPTWKGLLTTLIQEVKALPYDTRSIVRQYNALLSDTSKYLMLAQDIKDTLTADKFYDVLARIFGNPALQPTPTHSALTKISFSFVITTNYDRLIEKAYIKASKVGEIPPTLTQTNSRDIAYKIWNNEFFILKAHGDVAVRRDEIVMTESDYRSILFKNPGFQSAIQVLFSTKSLLFIGTSFTDPDFILLMRYLHSAYHGGGPPHYILINEKDILDVEAKSHLRDFKLHTIKYNPENNHQQILQFIQSLNKSTKH